MNALLQVITFVSGMDVVDAQSRKDSLRSIFTALKDGVYDLPCVSLISGQNALERLVATEDSLQGRRFKDILLIEGAQYGCAGLVRQLLAAGIGPEVPKESQEMKFKGWTPLSLAAHHGHFSIVHALASAGADIDRTADRSLKKLSPGNSALVAAASTGHEQIVRFLLDAGASLDLPGAIYGGTALLMGATNGFLGVVRLLVEAGADIEAPTDQKCTPLFAASEMGHASVVGYLLEKGARPDVTNIYGSTPLMTACRGGHQGVIDLLVKAGANLSAVDGDGATPLNLAAICGYVEAVECLLRKGARDPSMSVSFYLWFLNIFL